MLPTDGGQPTEAQTGSQRGLSMRGACSASRTGPPFPLSALAPAAAPGLSIPDRVSMIRRQAARSTVRGTVDTNRGSGGAGIAAEKRNRVNGEIRAERLRLIGEDGSQLGIVSVDEALVEAEQRGFDVVEMSPNADPPVCRLMDYGKFQFQQSKKRQAARRRQQQTQIKEVKFRPGTDDGDYQVKLRNLRRFLHHGHKIKVTLWFRGREMAHQELGQKLLQRIEGDLEEEAKVEQFPKLEGRRLTMVMTSRKPAPARPAHQPSPAAGKEPPAGPAASIRAAEDGVRDEAAAG